MTDILDNAKVEELKAERRSLRLLITTANSNCAAGVSVDVNKIAEYFQKLADGNAKLLAHFMAQEDFLSAENEAADHACYAKMVKDIRQASQPQQTCRLKPIEVRLPKVIAGDVASWLGFREALDKVCQASLLSEEEKMLQLIAALPPAEQMHIRGRSFDEAVRTLKDRFESTEELIEAVRSQFRTIAAKEHGNDTDKYKSLIAALESVISLSSKDEVRLEAFNRAAMMLPRPVYWSFIDLKASRKLEDLVSFLKVRVKGIGWLESAAGNDLASSPGRPVVKKKGLQALKSPMQRSFPSEVRKPIFKPKQAEKKINKLSDLSSEEENKPEEQYLGRVMLTAIVEAPESESDEEIRVQARLDGHDLSLLWDPGAPCNLLPASLFPKVRLTRRFESATGHPIRAHGPVWVDLQFSGMSIPTKAYVNDSGLAILGREFTGRTDAISDGRSTARVVLHHNNKKVVIYEKARGSGSAAGGLSAKTLKIFSVAYENDLEDSDDEEVTTPPAPVSSPALRKLLAKWEHLGTGIGCTDLVQHRIYIKSGTKPVNVRSCRKVAVKQMDAVQKAIDDMLSMGVIEESISEWCSAIVPVPKKDGSIRIAIDYRGVNELTEKDAYPMPRMDVIIERLAGAKIFSKLDLTKGYYQVPIAASDKRFTAFSFGKQLYQFTRMPFGLASAPQTFQRLMNRVLAGLPFAECYLDDIIIFSKSEKEHCQHLAEVFKALDKANLRFNPEKCKFGVEEVEYLGFRISHGCRQPTTSKIEKIASFPLPATKKSTRLVYRAGRTVQGANRAIQRLGSTFV